VTVLWHASVPNFVLAGVTACHVPAVALSSRVWQEVYVYVPVLHPAAACMLCVGCLLWERIPWHHRVRRGPRRSIIVIAVCRFWVTERHVFQERLQEEQKAAADTTDLAVKVAEQDAAIRAAKARILALRSQVRVESFLKTAMVCIDCRTQHVCQSRSCRAPACLPSVTQCLPWLPGVCSVSAECWTGAGPGLLIEAVMHLL
jgi:hypothetical protein